MYSNQHVENKLEPGRNFGTFKQTRCLQAVAKSLYVRISVNESGCKL
jgi:hypothetical protein